MVFSNSTSEDGIIQEIDRICNSDDTVYPLKAKTARVNIALDRFFTLAFQSDGRWSFDDYNQTTAPLMSINLVSGQQAYALDTFAYEIINILRPESLNSDGTHTLLTRLNRNDQDIVQGALTSYKSTPGQPAQYDLLGKYLYLYPAPNYNSVGGLSLYVERNKVAFVSTDTTKTPGIPSLFHPYLARYASLPFLIEKQKPQLNAIMKQIGCSEPGDPYYGGDELAIVRHFQRREKGVRKSLGVAYQDNR